MLWAVVIGFLIGIFTRSFLPLGISAIYFSVLLSAVAILFAFYDRLKAKHLTVAAIVLVSFGTGVVRMNSAVLVGDPALANRLGENITIEGVISDEPDVRENGVRVSLRTDSLIEGTNAVAVRAGILVLAPPHTYRSYGERVRVEGVLRLPQSFDTSSGRAFNYPAYLAKDGISYELGFAKIESLAGENTRENEGNFLKSSAIGIKQKFLEGLSLALPEPQGGLAGGITVGEKRGLGEEMNEIFRVVGLTHIIVLSGYNITIVINWVGNRLKYAPRAVNFAGAGLIAIFFALMTGGAAASVRAAAMAIIAAFGRMTGRLYIASRALGVVAFGMVLWNPYILAFDPGFQLSVIATLGLIWFTPFVATKLKWITEKYNLREIAATTVAAQIAVLPLIIYQNGQLPIFSLPANLLALIAVPPAMFLSAVAAVAGIISSTIAPIIGFPATILLTYIIEIAKFFSSLPFSSLSIGAFSAWWIFATYVAMIALVVFIKKRQNFRSGVRERAR